MLFLAGEAPTAPFYMTLALFVAFLGCVGVGVYLVRGVPDLFRTGEESIQKPQAASREDLPAA